MSTEMLNTNTTATETTAAPAATSSPEAGTSQTPAFTPGQAPNVDGTAAPVVPAAGGAQATPAAYTPNLKFKVMDKEHEIDPLFHALIKDADTEKKIREMHEKALGLDSVKIDRQMLKQKIDTVYLPLEKQFKETTQSLQVIDKMIDAGDYDNFFKTLQIPEQKILEWAVKKAQLMSLTPQEQAAYNQTVQERNQLYTLEQQNAQFQEQLFQQQVQARTFELDQELSKPEVLSMVTAFDTRAGMQGAFKNEVIKRGALYAHQGQDKSAADLVKELTGLFGHVVQQTPAGTQQPGTAGAAQENVAQQQTPQQKPPVIPNVGGQGTSPAKKAYRSLDQLRALANS